MAYKPAFNHPSPTDDDQLAMLELHKQGLSVRKIAKEIGWSFSTVSKYLSILGADTDRSLTAEATAARSRKLAERRIGLAEGLMDSAESMHERVWDEYEQVVTSPEGPKRIKTDEPPLREQADGIKAIDTYIGTIDRLLAGSTNPDTDAAKNVVLGIFEGLGNIINTAGADAGLDDGDKDHDYDIRTDPDQQVNTAPAPGEDVDGDEWEWEEYDDYYDPELETIIEAAAEAGDK